MAQGFNYVLTCVLQLNLKRKRNLLFFRPLVIVKKGLKDCLASFYSNIFFISVLEKIDSNVKSCSKSNLLSKTPLAY